MSSTGAWSSSLPLTPKSGADGRSSKPKVRSEKRGAISRNSSSVLVPIARPRASSRLCAEKVRCAAGGAPRPQPFALKAVVDVAAVEHRALDPVGGDEGEPRRPIGAEAAAPDADPRPVDVGAGR